MLSEDQRTRLGAMVVESGKGFTKPLDDKTMRAVAHEFSDLMAIGEKAEEGQKLLHAMIRQGSASKSHIEGLHRSINGVIEKLKQINRKDRPTLRSVDKTLMKR